MKAWHGAMGIAALALCAVSAPASAVVRGLGGQGQVLLYPYYTVNAGHSTLVSVTNLDVRSGKLLRVRFREGYNSRPVMEFNVFLNLGDVWTAAVFALGDGQAAAVTTADTSCAVAMPGAAGGGLPNGQRYHTFSTASFTGANLDAYREVSPARTRDGFIEVFEMGDLPVFDDVTPGSPVLWHHLGWNSGGEVADCAAANAYLEANAATLLTSPSGGLAGSEALVNPFDGTLQQVEATALDEFRVTPLYATLGDAHPDLADAEADADGKVRVKLLESPFRGDAPLKKLTLSEHTVPASRAIDAVTAVLGSGLCTQGEVIADAAKGEAGEWVITLPTRAFYDDASVAPPRTDRTPFGDGPQISGAKCHYLLPSLIARNGASIAPCEYAGTACSQSPPVFPADNSKAVCRSSSVLSFGQGGQISDVLGATYPIDAAFRADAAHPEIGHEGHARMNGEGYLTVFEDGHVVYGLPFIGFSATRYRNANVQPGVLANYTWASPLTPCEALTDTAGY